MRDAVVVGTTTTTYTLLHVGHINNLVEVSPIPAHADLPEFLRPPLTQPRHEFILEPEPLPDHIPLLELRLRSPNFPPLKPIVPEIPVPVIKISSSGSHIPTADPHQALSSFESNPLEETSTTASRVSRCNPMHACDSGPHWIRSPIIPRGHGRRGREY